jgi:hypothetical protein
MRYRSVVETVLINVVRSTSPMPFSAIRDTSLLVVGRRKPRPVKLEAWQAADFTSAAANNHVFADLLAHLAPDLCRITIMEASIVM